MLPSVNNTNVAPYAGDQIPQSVPVPPLTTARHPDYSSALSPAAAFHTMSAPFLPQHPPFFPFQTFLVPFQGPFVPPAYGHPLPPQVVGSSLPSFLPQMGNVQGPVHQSSQHHFIPPGAQAPTPQAPTPQLCGKTRGRAEEQNQQRNRLNKSKEFELQRAAVSLLRLHGQNESADRVNKVLTTPPTQRVPMSTHSTPLRANIPLPPPNPSRAISQTTQRTSTIGVAAQPADRVGADEQLARLSGSKRNYSESDEETVVDEASGDEPEKVDSESNDPAQPKRYRWSKKMHQAFCLAYFSLPEDKRTPKTILTTLKHSDPSLTSPHVKSHLQKLKLRLADGREVPLQGPVNKKFKLENSITPFITPENYLSQVGKKKKR